MRSRGASSASRRRTGVVLPARGSAALGTTNYAITGTVRYVSPSGTNSGNGDTVGAPWQTVTYAVANAPSGATIVLRAGTYRERVYFTTSSKPLNFQAYPGEVVWLDGGLVKTGWASAGTNVWSVAYTPIPAFTPEAGSDPMRGDPNQCWIDSVAQKQIADGTTPAAGQFSVNRTNNTMTIFSTTNPSGKLVEVSDKDYNHFGSTTNVLGIGFRKFSPRNTDGWAFTVVFAAGANNSFMENCFIQDSSQRMFGTGESAVRVSNVRVKNVTMEDFAWSGVNFYNSDSCKIENCIIRRGNRLLYDQENQCGAVKGVWSNDLLYSNNLIQDFPKGYGLWVDTDCACVNMVWNEVDGSVTIGTPMDLGIEVEASDGVKGTVPGTVGPQRYHIIAGNKVYNCTTGGIKMFSSGYAKIWNNDLRGNGVPVYLQQDARTNGGTHWGTSQSTFETKGIEIVNNMLPAGISYDIGFIAYDDSGTWNKLGASFFDLLDTNWFATTGSMVQLGKLGGARNSYNTLAALAAAGSDVGGPLGAKLGSGNVQQSTRPLDSAATGLSTLVATALGLSVGTKAFGPPT